MQDEENEHKELHVDVQLSPVDDLYYYIDSKFELPEELTKGLIHQTYFFFVIELRTGIKTEDLPKIKSMFETLCEDIIDKDLRGISFIINGKHHIIKTQNLQSIKELLNETFTITQQDDYLKTLQATRHAITSVTHKLHQTNITFLFFFSHLEIDHSLGVKKRSYINRLNEHDDQCREEVERLVKTVKRYTEKCNAYIISYDKTGLEEQDYSLCDTDLMNRILVYLGSHGTLTRNYSYNELGRAFEEVSAMMLFKMYTLSLVIPVHENTETFSPNYELIILICSNAKDFKGEPIYIKRQLLDQQKLKNKGIQLLKGMLFSEKQEDDFGRTLSTVLFKTDVNYCDLDLHKLLKSQCIVLCLQINQLCRTISKKIVSYKRRYEGGKSYLDMTFDKDMFLEMRDRLEFIYERSKELFIAIREGKFKGKEQFEAYEGYGELKGKIDRTREIFVDILKKQIGGSEIGQLSQVISLSSIKNSLKNKLLKRINANPFLLDQVYNKVYQAVDNGNIDYPQLEVDSSNIRKDLGNCVISDQNFVKAMMNYDALGLAFEIERPMSAIADPGRIRIRQLSPSLMSVSNFFQKFLYKIDYTPDTVELIFQTKKYLNPHWRHLINTLGYDQALRYKYRTESTLDDVLVHSFKKQAVKIDSLEWGKNVTSNTFNPNQMTKQSKQYRQRSEGDYLREVGGLHKFNYTQKWDYTNRVERTESVLGFIPLFLTEEHWRVAKHLMKPCLAFTATGEPLGYLFSQFQTIPFMVLSSIIRTCQELEYAIGDDFERVKAIGDETELNKLQTIINEKKKKLTRFTHLREAVELTCRAIMHQLSSQRYDPPLKDLVAKRFQDYKDPLNRTIDIIPNNSAFLGQLFTAFRFNFLQKPTEDNFHYFFVRLIQQQLRRQTYGWNDEWTQDAFVNKILNLDAQSIKKNQHNIIVVSSEDFLLKFTQALEGVKLRQQSIQIYKEQLQMMLRKQGKFNQNQKMLITQYQRMYITRVVWMWYIRFLLYQPLDKIFVRRWKSLGIINSYMLFTMIIQNKKESKNYKRRQAIMEGKYADPFDYYQAREYLENQFTSLHDKIVDGMKKEVQYKQAKGAAEVFAITETLEEAAGVLLDATNNLIPKIFQEMREQVPLFAEKMEILVHGVYRGVKVMRWMPSRKKNNVLRYHHPLEYQRFQYKF